MKEGDVVDFSACDSASPTWTPTIKGWPLPDNKQGEITPQKKG